MQSLGLLMTIIGAVLVFGASSDEYNENSVLCTCNPKGTKDNGTACNELTGECQCKPNVENRPFGDCDLCLPEHFGLSELDPNGCKPCDCDFGGAIDNQCDIVTGQCRCRPFLKGRRCDEVEDFYFTGPLDYLSVEAELAEIYTPETRVILRKPSDLPGETTWTGPGFIQVFEGSTLTFKLPEIYRTMNYYLVIRFEHDPAFPSTWESVNADLFRVNSSPNDVCNLDNDNQTISLPGNSSSTALALPFCLEKYERYEITLTFNQYDDNQNKTKGANILIDAIVLLPHLGEIPFLNPYHDLKWKREWDQNNGSNFKSSGNNTEPSFDDIVSILEDGPGDGLMNFRSEGEVENLWIDAWFPGEVQAEQNIYLFLKFECMEQFMKARPGRTIDQVVSFSFSMGRTSPMPKECEKILNSISFFMFEGALYRSCNCDYYGTINGICDKYYGDCECKSLVVGRKCNSCAPGSFGFPECQACDCHPQGSQDNLCHEDYGYCKCKENITGKNCSKCKLGYRSFPDCHEAEYDYLYDDY